MVKKSTSSDKRKQQLIFWVVLLVVVIVMAWVWSWQWSFSIMNKEQESAGSFSKTMSKISTEWQSFSEEWQLSKQNISQLTDALKDRFMEDKKQTEEFTEAILYEIDKLKVDSWPQYLSEDIEFSYPTEWRVQVSDNKLELLSGEDQVLTITIFSDKNDLPDNINELEFTDWLDEQLSRELGIFDSYNTADIGLPYEIYQVDSKGGQEFKNYFWQTQKIYWLAHTDNEQYQKMINLIIPTIK